MWLLWHCGEKASGFAGVGAAEHERVRKQEGFTEGGTTGKRLGWRLVIYKTENGQELPQVEEMENDKLRDHKVIQCGLAIGLWETRAEPGRRQGPLFWTEDIVCFVKEFDPTLPTQLLPVLQSNPPLFIVDVLLLPCFFLAQFL